MPLSFGGTGAGLSGLRNYQMFTGYNYLWGSDRLGQSWHEWLPTPNDCLDEWSQSVILQTKADSKGKLYNLSLGYDYQEIPNNGEGKVGCTLDAGNLEEAEPGMFPVACNVYNYGIFPFYRVGVLDRLIWPGAVSGAMANINVAGLTLTTTTITYSVGTKPGLKSTYVPMPAPTNPPTPQSSTSTVSLGVPPDYPGNSKGTLCWNISTITTRTPLGAVSDVLCGVNQTGFDAHGLPIYEIIPLGISLTANAPGNTNYSSAIDMTPWVQTYLANRLNFQFFTDSYCVPNATGSFSTGATDPRAGMMSLMGTTYQPNFTLNFISSNYLTAGEMIYTGSQSSQCIQYSSIGTSGGLVWLNPGGIGLVPTSRNSGIISAQN